MNTLAAAVKHLAGVSFLSSRDCDPLTEDDYSTSFIIATDDNGAIYYAHSNGDRTWSGFAQIAQLGSGMRGAAIAD